MSKTERRGEVRKKREISFSEFIVHVHAKYCNDLCEFQADLSLGVERVCSRSTFYVGRVESQRVPRGYSPVARESLSKKINCIIDVNFRAVWRAVASGSGVN